jgi:hypothetical protein
MKGSVANTGWRPTRCSVLLTACVLSMASTPPAARAQTALMDDHPHHDFGKLSPHAPAELARFAFLIGSWRGEAKIISPSGAWQTYQVTWLGCFILEGYAIADQYRMTDSSGKLIVLGMNFRTFDAASRTWNIRWLNALTGTWMNLVSEELGGIHFDGQSITYAFKESVGGHAYTRATYTSHSPTHFTWKGDQSSDAGSWSDFMLVQCYRNY